MFTLEQVSRAYYNKSYKLINKVTNAAITDNKFNDQYLCVSFFESITRTIFVQKEEEDQIQEGVTIIKEDIEVVQEVTTIIIGGNIDQDLLRDHQVEEVQEGNIGKEIIEEVEVKVEIGIEIGVGIGVEAKVIIEILEVEIKIKVIILEFMMKNH
jgi:hypothetical protein